MSKARDQYLSWCGVFAASQLGGQLRGKVVGEMAIYRQPFSDGCNLLDSNSLSHWGPEALEGKPLC
jgi:hypothetical protein